MELKLPRRWRTARAFMLLLAILMTAALGVGFRGTAFAADTVDVVIPDDFLQTNDPTEKRLLLSTEFTVNFKGVTIREALDYIMRKSGSLDPTPPANIIKVDLLAAPENPRVTRQFDRTPLRTVLYLLGKDAALKIGWALGTHHPHVIQIGKP